MAKKDSDKGNVVDLLQVGHFGDPGITTPDAGDPVTETMMVLTLDQLTEYSRNPRKARNAEYEALKASYIVSGRKPQFPANSRRENISVAISH